MIYPVLFQSIDLLEEDNRRLQNLLNWRDQEGVFWKWMESVLEAKTVSTSPLSSEDSRRPVHSPKVNNLIQTSAAMRLHQSHKRLHDIIIKYESIVEHLERVCENKVRSFQRLIKGKSQTCIVIDSFFHFA